MAFILMDNNTEIIKDFDSFSATHKDLSTLRKEAISSFEKTGFPTRKNEEWKYVDLTQLLKETLHLKISGTAPSLTRKDVSQFIPEGFNAVNIVFENGIFNAAASDDTGALTGISINDLKSNSALPEVSKYLGKVAQFNDQAFVAINTAFVIDGVYIHINDRAVIEKPVHIINVHTGTSEKTVNSRNLILAGKESKAVIAESYHTLDSTNGCFTNNVTEIVVNKNANLEYVKIQNESNDTNHISFTQVNQDRDSIFNHSNITLGGKLTRNNLHIRLNDVNCTSHLNGLYVLNGSQFADNHTLVDHAMPECFSNELYKGIVDDHATGVFNGKIFVRKDAQKTNAYQSNKTILLSDDAQMNTKPQLEIFADDVKCTHGATTGQLDEDALFYLRARGIGEQSARALLNIAFAADVLENISSEALQHHLLHLVEEKLLK